MCWQHSVRTYCSVVKMASLRWPEGGSQPYKDIRGRCVPAEGLSKASGGSEPGVFQDQLGRPQSSGRWGQRGLRANHVGPAWGAMSEMRNHWGVVCSRVRWFDFYFNRIAGYSVEIGKWSKWSRVDLGYRLAAVAVIHWEMPIAEEEGKRNGQDLFCQLYLANCLRSMRKRDQSKDNTGAFCLIMELPWTEIGISWKSWFGEQLRAVLNMLCSSSKWRS